MAITVVGNPTAVSVAVRGKDGAGSFQAFQFTVNYANTANPVQPLLDAAGFTGMQAAVVSVFDGGGVTLTSGGAAISTQGPRQSSSACLPTGRSSRTARVPSTEQS